MTIDKVKELLADHFEMELSEIQDDATFETMNIDSLDVVEFMMEVEDEFGIEVKVAEAGKTVTDLAAYIDSKLA